VNRTVDTAVACCVFLLGVFVLINAQHVRPASVIDPIGSEGGPYLVGILLTVGGGLLALRRLLRWRQEGPLVPDEGTPDDAGVEQGSAARALSIWVAAFVYVLAMPVAGYLLATPFFLAAVLWLFSVRGWMLVLLPVGFSVPIYLIFVEFLRVRLPTGILDTPLRLLGLV
jgi:hypothetical protein